MASIKINIFRGIKPKLAPQLLENNEAQTAENVRTSAGELRPWFNDLEVSNLSARNLIKTLYKYLTTWLTWDATVNVVPAPVANDTSSILYYTGDGLPKMTNEDHATDSNYGPGAQGSLPYSFLPMAVPQFLDAPVYSSGDTGSGMTRGYKCTIVSRLPGDTKEYESPPSPASLDVECQTTDVIVMTLPDLIHQTNTIYSLDDWVIPTAGGNYIYKCVTAGTSGGSEPTWGTVVDQDTVDSGCSWRCYKRVNEGSDMLVGIRLYRTAIGDEFSSYQRVYADYSGTHYQTIPIAALGGNVSDDPAEDLGVVISTDGYIKPPDDLDNLVAMPGGMLAGNSGKDIYFCKPYYPHLWSPAAYSLKYSPVAMGVKGNTLIIGTEAIPALLIGSSPETMTQRDLPKTNPCLSNRGLASLPDGVAWPTTDGLFFCDGNTGVILTPDHFTKDEWADLYPTTMTATFTDNKYWGFYSSGSNVGGVVVDVQTGDVTTLDLEPGCVHVDKTTGELYYLLSTPEVVLLEDGTTYPARTNSILFEDGTSKILRE